MTIFGPRDAYAKSYTAQEQMLPNKFKRVMVGDEGVGGTAAVASWQSVQVSRPRDWGKGRVVLRQFYKLDDRYVSEKAAAEEVRAHTSAVPVITI